MHPELAGKVAISCGYFYAEKSFEGAQMCGFNKNGYCGGAYTANSIVGYYVTISTDAQSIDLS